MNTGIQDAFNLAWKLAMVLKGFSNESLLQSYQKERQSLAKKMIKSTDHFYRMVTSNRKMDRKIRLKLAPFLFKIFFPVIERQKSISRYLFNKISEIGINYRNSPLSKNGSHGLFRPDAPGPGDRLPCLPFKLEGNVVNLQDMGNDVWFHLFIFSRNSIPEEFLSYFRQYSGWLSTLFIPFDSGTMPLYNRLGIGKTGVYLIRPDMYIAYRSKKLIIKNLEKYLKQLSIVTPA